MLSEGEVDHEVRPLMLVVRGPLHVVPTLYEVQGHRLKRSARGHVRIVEPNPSHVGHDGHVQRRVRRGQEERFAVNLSVPVMRQAEFAGCTSRPVDASTRREFGETHRRAPAGPGCSWTVVRPANGCTISREREAVLVAEVAAEPADAPAFAVRWRLPDEAMPKRQPK